VGQEVFNVLAGRPGKLIHRGRADL
jgi:hypothetical protein